MKSKVVSRKYKVQWLFIIFINYLLIILSILMLFNSNLTFAEDVFIFYFIFNVEHTKEDIYDTIINGVYS